LMHHRWCDIKNDEFHRVIFKNDAITARHISARSQKYKNIALFENALRLM
jgi:hypothetical protein